MERECFHSQEKGKGPLAGFFGKIPASLIYDKSLQAEIPLFALITLLSIKHGYCWAKNSYLADSLGVSERSIQKGIAKLEEKEYLCRRYATKPRYRILIPNMK